MKRNLPTTGHGRPPPKTGTQPVNDLCSLLLADLAQIECEIDALKFVQSGPSTSATATSPVRSKPAAFTTAQVQWGD